LERLAEPTAGATRLVFRHGAVTTDLAPATVESMGRLGSVFGEIAYLVDAIQDQKEDAEKGAFNALSATGMTELEAGQLLGVKRDEMLASLDALPIDIDRKRSFAARLQSNLAPYLFMRQRPDRVVVVRRQGPSFCGNCWDAICCCETIQCCDCMGSGCCDCMCAGCGTLR
jgi:hypothetical protein